MLFIYWLIYFQHVRLSFCIENTNLKKNRMISSFPLDDHLYCKIHRNVSISVCGVRLQIQRMGGKILLFTVAGEYRN
jgi:hypothetical protein